MKLIAITVVIFTFFGCSGELSGSSSAVSPADGQVKLDTVSIDEEKIVADMRKEDIQFEEHSRYFGLYAFGPAKNFIFFKAQDVVIDVKFTSPESLVATVNQFTPEQEELVPLWINNQHSDGLYGEAPEPKTTRIASDDVVILESRKLGSEAGENGDEYDVYSIKYFISAQEVSKGLTPAVVYTTTFYERTKDISCTPVCER